MTDNSEQEWEYRVEVFPVNNADPRGTKRRIEARLNELGRDGWELISGKLGTDQLEQTLRRRANTP